MKNQYIMLKFNNMIIVLASNNLHKLKEFQHIFADTKIKLVSQSDFPIPETEETGLTFVENAILKARNACHHTNLPSLADDSGLCVDALNGQPGIHSARFAGKDSTQQQKIDALLDAIKNIPEEERTARYHCVLVLLQNEFDPEPIIAESIWEGKILTSARGNKGFGFDPIFFVPEFNCSAAELEPAEKNVISHRGKALKLLLEKISSKSKN
ncbi:MAG: RdgB/HAM1 family non-canonical purine NTP pyrophosphatase [Gammaproteobacteria bacterium]|jgi:XTP/dITP diphosphohydrolase